VWDAYGRWESAAGSYQVRAHAAYLAAVDREEAAANAYAEMIGRVALLLAPNDARSTELLSQQSARG
jgi:hypothetical protein